MSALIRFEFLKTFRKPWVSISILVFCFVNLAGIYLSNKQENDRQLESTCAKSVCGPINAEKTALVIAEDERLSKLIYSQKYSREYDPQTWSGYAFHDWVYFHTRFLPWYRYAVSYPYEMQTVVNKASENMGFYALRGERYEVNKNRQIVNLFSGRNIPEVQYLTGTEKLLQYDFSSFLLLLPSVLLITPVFVSERENRMNQILQSLPGGSQRVTLAKQLYSVALMTVLCLLFSLLDLGGFRIFYPATRA